MIRCTGIASEGPGGRRIGVLAFTLQNSMVEDIFELRASSLDFWDRKPQDILLINVKISIEVFGEIFQLGRGGDVTHPVQIILG